MVCIVLRFALATFAMFAATLGASAPAGAPVTRTIGDEGPLKLRFAGSMLVAVASARAVATPVETLGAASPVAAYAGTAMWSRRNPDTGRFRLVQAIDGATPTVVAVAEREGPFDVDLGTNRRGSTYAVYSRDGDLFRLEPRSGTETKLTGLSSPRLAERNPTIQRGEIAFLRFDGSTNQLRIGNTSSASNATRLLKTDRVGTGRVLVSAELGMEQIAYVESFIGDFEGHNYRLRVRNLTTGRDRVVYRTNGGGLNDANITKPSFTDDLRSFVWARTNNGSETGNRIVRYMLRTGALSYAKGNPRYFSTAWVSDRLGAVTSSTNIEPLGAGDDECHDASREVCRIEYTGPLSFTLKP